MSRIKCSASFWAWVALFLAAGCNFGDIQFTANGPRQPARQAGCDFQLLTTSTAGFTEIGVVDVTVGSFLPGENTYGDLASFKEAISPYVCKAGGEAALAHAQNGGLYIKATVLKRMAAGVPTPPPLPTGPSPTLGCQFDTQCKGARLCVKGTCVDAPASAPSPTTTP
jgi:hypothetical protein